MNRLTDKICAVGLNIGKQEHETALYFGDEPIYENTKQAILKLAEFENADLEPSEVAALKTESEAKDKRIAVLEKALSNAGQCLNSNNSELCPQDIQEFQELNLACDSDCSMCSGNWYNAFIKQAEKELNEK